ncbi:MAG: VCBS repeat-containing protein, partial [Planctomycetota bacterium]
AAPAEPAAPEILRPDSPESDLALSEAAAQAAERDLLQGFTSAVAQGDEPRAIAALVSDGFRGEAPAFGESQRAGVLSVTWLMRSPSGGTTPAEFVRALMSSCRLETLERVEAEILRFELAADESEPRATALLRQRWAGIAAASGDQPGSREDVTHYGEVELRSENGRWRLAQYEPAENHRHTHGPGVHLRGPAEPIYLDRTDSVGLTLGTSAKNRSLIQSFIDRHLTLALGGLTVTDFNGDERPDLIATRAEETTIVFLNDGKGGFRPEPFDIPALSDRPAFLAKVDLDGDGLDELVGTEVSRFEGSTAFAGLWTRTPESDQAQATAASPWRHVPRAFALPNPIGMRRLAVQNVVPLDADGDGDLDLFFAVYGNAASRGEHYNTVEAHDGADNYLLINQGGLRFTEESDARGITGTGYTYVALGFDADHDVDVDLYEGNDFGPNVLWRNDGGRFVEDASSGLGGVSAYTMGAALADLEADGTWDLYVSNMSSEEGMRMVPRASDLSKPMRERVDTIARGNMFYRQPGKETEENAARWTEHAESLGLHEGEWAWGCQFVDVDGDGAQEILVTNGFASHENEALGDWQTYYWRQVIDDGARLERGESSVNVNESLRFQGSFNGHERDRLFVRLDGNDPDRPWVDGGYCLGFDGAHDGRAVVPIDPDGDGDLDLALLTLGGLRFLENQAPAQGAWLRLRLLEPGPSGAPRPAVGARVTYEHGGKRAARHVQIGTGKLQHPTRINRHRRVESSLFATVHDQPWRGGVGARLPLLVCAPWKERGRI